MSIPEMIPLIKGVLTEPKVIITTVIIFLYIDIVAKIVRSRKKKKQINFLRMLLMMEIPKP